MSARQANSVRRAGRHSRIVPARHRSGEAGYTMLFAVFLAATMLISLSVLTLNIITQGQREKEEEMVWRGHQYERGIRRYVQKFGRYPGKVDDMVKATSGVRYMREAYKDPMNKEDGSWRFIYVTPAGALIGSVRYTSLVQMALMDKMMQMGGAAMAGMGGMPGVGGFQKRECKGCRECSRCRECKERAARAPSAPHLDLAGGARSAGKTHPRRSGNKGIKAARIPGG